MQHTSTHKPQWFFIIILAIVSAFLIVFGGLFFLSMFALLLLVWFFSHHLDWGWYVLVFLSPMIYWVIRLGDYPELFESFPLLLRLEAAAVEFWAVFLLMAYLVSLVRTWLQGKKILVRLPGIWWFGLFLASAVVSLVNVGQGELLKSAWYLGRFIVFFYIAYVFLGANIIKDKEIFRKSLYAFVSVGLFAALMGIVSLIIGTWKQVYGVARVSPFAIGSWAPFGDQHIFIAETLIVTVLLFLYIWYEHRKKHYATPLAILCVLVLLVALGTLSRAAWVTTFVSLVVFVVIMKERVPFRTLWKRYAWIVILFIPLIAYFAYFVLSSYLIVTSNAARFTLTEIAWMEFLNHPYIGAGVGTFVSSVSSIYLFFIEFGAPMDAHGIGQKLLAEQGMFGFLTFLVFISWLLSRMYERYKDPSYHQDARTVALLGIFLVVAPLTFQIFNTQYYHAIVWVPIALAIGGHIAYSKETRSKKYHINFKLTSLARYLHDI